MRQLEFSSSPSTTRRRFFVSTVDIVTNITVVFAVSLEIGLNPNYLRKPNLSRTHQSLSLLGHAQCRSRCWWAEEPNVGLRIHYRVFQSGLIRIGGYSRWVNVRPGLPGEALSTVVLIHTFSAGCCGAVSFPGAIVGRGMSFHFVDRLHHVPFPVPFRASIHLCLHPIPIPVDVPWDCLGLHVHVCQVHFRSEHAPTPELQQEAARFFGTGPTHASQVPMSMPAQPFDMARLRDALPTAVPMQLAQISGVAGGAWAADFLTRQPVMSQTHAQTQGHAQAHAQVQAQAIPATRVDQHNRVQTPASAVGGVQGASACLYTAYNSHLSYSLFCFRLLLATRCRRCTSVELGVCELWHGSDGRDDECNGCSCTKARRPERP